MKSTEVMFVRANLTKWIIIGRIIFLAIPSGLLCSCSILMHDAPNKASSWWKSKIMLLGIEASMYSAVNVTQGYDANLG